MAMVHDGTDVIDKDYRSYFMKELYQLLNNNSMCN